MLKGDKPFKALATVATDRPLAAVQILFFIFVSEALGQFNQVKDGAAPGDLGFDPLNLKPSDPETWEKVQVQLCLLLPIRDKNSHDYIMISCAS